MSNFNNSIGGAGGSGGISQSSVGISQSKGGPVTGYPCHGSTGPGADTDLPAMPSPALAMANKARGPGNAPTASHKPNKSEGSAAKKGAGPAGR